MQGIKGYFIAGLTGSSVCCALECSLRWTFCSAERGTDGRVLSGFISANYQFDFPPLGSSHRGVPRFQVEVEERVWGPNLARRHKLGANSREESGGGKSLGG